MHPNSSSRPKRRKADEDAEAAASAATATAPRAEPKTSQYHCDYCRADITHVVRIKCAECKNFDLCVECFARGVEVAGGVNHRACHAYRVMDRATEPIFDEEWGAEEELLLLEAIEMYGFGNWSDIAEHVGGNKTKGKCETHYVLTYLGTELAPPTCLAGGIVKRKAADMTASSSSKSEADADADADMVKSEHAASSSSSSSSSSTSTVTFSQIPPSPPTHALPLRGEGNAVGYLPHREDFETEWENEAETVLADMEFRADDTPGERELKLRMLRIYNARLDQRAERKQFILERGLLFPKEKKRSREEKEAHNALKVFSRFHSAEEHDQFVKGLVNEQRIRRRIEQLQVRVEQR
jgi:transcriptional adapter 2-alpha